LRSYERDIATWARGITLVSDAEVGIYRRWCGDGPVHAVGNGVDFDYFSASVPKPSTTLAFVGALDYRPNVDGICWFCQEVWPTVHRARPEARLELVGRRPVKAVQRLREIAGVHIVGQVPDVRPFLQKAGIVISPLRIARGIQNKVLEALAMARAAIVSPQSLEGLHAVPGRHLLRASAPAEWVSAIHYLLDNPEVSQRLGQAGRQWVEQHHSWESCLAPLADILRLPARSCVNANRSEIASATIESPTSPR
jgi:sugar transferase (PEP-CTERM/EpsH1 system associated)